MNIQKIFDAVNEDDMNSPLLPIIFELERRGYTVKLEGVEVTAGDMGDNLFLDLEKAVNEYIIELYENSNINQKFKIIFTGYHQFSFHPYN